MENRKYHRAERGIKNRKSKCKTYRPWRTLKMRKHDHWKRAVRAPVFYCGPVRLWIARDEGEQDLLVVHDQNIPLAAGQKERNLEGFCCQLHNASPDRVRGLKWENRPVITLKNYAFGSRGNQFTRCFREAVWCFGWKQSSNISVAEDSPQAEPVKQLRKQVCDLTNKPTHTVQHASTTDFEWREANWSQAL